MSMSRFRRSASAGGAGVLLIAAMSVALPQVVASADDDSNPPCENCAALPVPASGALSSLAEATAEEEVVVAGDEPESSLPDTADLVAQMPDDPSDLAVPSKGTRMTQYDAAGPSNPYGCYGQTDFPHLSINEASVHGRTRCARQVVELSVATTLYRGRWFGAELLENDASSRSFSDDSRDATPHWRCLGSGTYTYEGDSNHEAFDGGRHFYQSTTRNLRFLC
jgi:hypothetical protein